MDWGMFATWMVAWGWLVAIVLLVVFFRQVLRLFGVVVVPEDSLGIVNKKFVLFGRNKRLPDGKIVALNGEAGYQAGTLAPGLHFWLFPWQYKIQVQKFINLAEGQIGIVEALDGEPLSGGSVLGKDIGCDAYQNAQAFLRGGGQRGPQLRIIPPGTYRINTELFSVRIGKALDIPENMVGIVTTKEGKPLASGEIAGKAVPGHSMFQEPQKFIDGGGFKGLQEQVILAGRYFINPLFATVELKPMTSVPIANVGVVIAYVGAEGHDVTGDSFKHGNLVTKGQKGVWVEPLDPGMYPINPFVHKVENVPTANVVLNWATGKSEAHNLDKNLSTITVRSSDGFKFNLDVSQIIHIPRTDAPKVIARFGSVANLVTQVLEPTIGNYFRNAAQGSDVIEFLKGRQERQQQARASIADALAQYNVGAVDTLIGDIVPPEELMKTLTDRKLAEQEKVTYQTQRLAEDARKEMEQARAMAATQPKVVDAERKVAIAEFDARSSVAQAEGAAKAKIAIADADARAKVTIADADARVLRVIGEAEASKVLNVGTAEADVINKKTLAVGQGNYALMEVSRSLADNKIPLVPQIMAGGGGPGQEQGGSLVSVLLASLIAKNMESPAPNGKADRK